MAVIVTFGVFLLAVFATAQQQDVNQCGRHRSARISGGVAAGAGEYPAVAGLWMNSKNMIVCGATIVAPRYVVTAAHCLQNQFNPQLADVKVQVGLIDYRNGEQYTLLTMSFPFKQIMLAIFQRPLRHTLDRTMSSAFWPIPATTRRPEWPMSVWSAPLSPSSTTWPSDRRVCLTAPICLPVATSTCWAGVGRRSAARRQRTCCSGRACR